MNKWNNLIPRTIDVKATMRFLHLLQQWWPGTRCVCEPGPGNSESMPTLKAIHILWPWCKSVLRVVGKSIFCDGTHQVTIYEYKIVCLTTLDGQHHHRPLMLSFITNSTSEQWTVIFDILYGYVASQRHQLVASSCIPCCLHTVYVQGGEDAAPAQSYDL